MLTPKGTAAGAVAGTEARSVPALTPAAREDAGTALAGLKG